MRRAGRIFIAVLIGVVLGMLWVTDNALRAPPRLHLGGRRVRGGHGAPYTGAGGGAFASSSRTAGPTAPGSQRAP